VPWRSHLFGALRHPSEPRILLLRSDRAWRLPHVLVSERVWLANARLVVSAFEQRLGTRPWLLRQIHLAENEDAEMIEAVFELELTDLNWRRPAHGRWVGQSDLAALSLADDGQRGLLTEYLAMLERIEVSAQRPPWARPGWLKDVREWIEDEVRRLGYVLVGLEQVKHWSISSVLRVATDGPDVYFKVPMRLPLFADEAVVTLRLAERFPGYVPTPLAVEPEHGWMLLPDFRELFGWKAPFEIRLDMLRRFAGLQRRTAALTDKLLADGCLDRRLDVLESQIDPLLNDPHAVHRLTVEEVTELRRLGPTLKDICRRLADYGLPPTLVHGDLHLGNVTRIDGELQYFDWTDACVAHPFIDLLSLQWERDEASRAALLDAYLEPWQQTEPVERLREAVELGSVVIPLHHAVSYQHIVAGLEPSAKLELDATHEFLREILERARALAGA
jgi:hypothetical protein